MSKERVRGGVLIFLVMMTSIAGGCAGEVTMPAAESSGPYLGQDPPGMGAEIFARGIVSTGYGEYNAVFSTGGEELHYVLAGPPHRVIVSLRQDNGRWTQPQVVPFSDPHILEFCISPDGNRAVLISRRPLDGTEEPSDTVRNWIVEKTNSRWGEPEILDQAIVGPCSISSTGDLYFSTLRLGGAGGDDIFVSRFVDGEFAEPEDLGTLVNTSLHEADPFIAPDESYLVFVKADTQAGTFDLWVSFCSSDGLWTQARTLGESVNSVAKDLLPTVSPDGKYLFFTSERRVNQSVRNRPVTYDEKIRILDSPGNGYGDIYWVDARVIEELRPPDSGN